MRKTMTILGAVALTAAMAASVSADDRVAMGEAITVGAGERVHDVATMGGDITVAGVAEGDVASMGGDIGVLGTVEGDVATAGGDVRVEGRVEGSVATAGGDVQVDGVIEGDVETAGGRVHFGPEGRVEGRVRSHGGQVAAAVGGGGSALGAFFRRIGAFAMLFLLAFGFRLVAQDRFHALRAAMVRSPLKTPLLGLAFFCAAVVAILGSAVTVVGLPVAAVLAFALVLVVYLGLAMSAAVIGAVLPWDKLQGRENLRLAAGVGALFFLSLLPFVGNFALVVAALFGLGSVAATRLGGRPMPPASEGPYR